jgi:hypothetical protein
LPDCFGDHCRTPQQATGRLKLCDICRKEHERVMRLKRRRKWRKRPDVRAKHRAESLARWHRRAAEPGFLDAVATRKRIRYVKDEAFRLKTIEYQRLWRMKHAKPKLPCPGLAATGKPCKRETVDGLGCRWHRARKMEEAA